MAGSQRGRKRLVEMQIDLTRFDAKGWEALMGSDGIKTQREGP